MARLGIDFGTTNTIVAIHDRGTFSIVRHQAQTGVGAVAQEIYPSAIHIEQATGQRYFGIDAERRFAQVKHGSGDVFIPSLKRKLHDYAEGRTVNFGDNGDGQFEFDPQLLLTEYLQSLASSIHQSQELSVDEPLETVITWPANANGAQRYVTRQAFRNAGFVVIDSVTEPTASAIELADWSQSGRKAKNEPFGVAVFDLGGGTFDASVLWVEDNDFQVLASSGIETLGGDDFDQALLDLFLAKLKKKSGEPTGITRHALLRHARSQKETLSTGAVKSLFLSPMDFGLKGRPITVAASEYEAKLRGMLAPAVKMLGDVIDAGRAKEPKLAGDGALTVYLVGGSSKLPVVADMVSSAFPKMKVMQSDKPFRSVAMGAAITAADRVTFQDVFARHFGLMRLRDHGQQEVFDAIFPAGTPVPHKGEPPLEKTAEYTPRHNIGHLRYLECSSVDGSGRPDGSVREWNDILFPYDPAEPITASHAATEVEETDRFADQAVREVYRCDSDGVITVELRRLSAGDKRRYEIGRD